MNMRKWIPYVVFLGFFLWNIITGILLITGISPPIYYEDPIGFAPLTFTDLLLLVALNIPALIIIGISIFKTKNQPEDNNSN